LSVNVHADHAVPFGNRRSSDETEKWGKVIRAADVKAE
jgi:hypothetical protein